MCLITRTIDEKIYVDNWYVGTTVELARLEYERSKKQHPENPVYHMRPMLYTGSFLGKELLELFNDSKQ